MTRVPASIVLLSVALTAGCSTKPDAARPAESKTGSIATAATPDSATGTTNATQPDCPSAFSFPVRPPDAPVDDILGMRQGSSLADAMLFLRCRAGAHFVFTEETSGIIRDTHGQKFRQVVTATDGVARKRPYNYAKAITSGESGTPEFDFVTEQVMFWSLGLQDQETVWGIWRSQFFNAGEQPTMAQLAEQLAAKYGEPHSFKESERGTQVTWRYDLSGRPLPKSNADMCIVGATIDATQLVSADCGLTVEAYIAKASNPLLAGSVSVAVIDQAKYLDATRDFEQVLVAAQAQQRSSEASKAKPVTKF